MYALFFFNKTTYILINAVCKPVIIFVNKNSISYLFAHNK